MTIRFSCECGQSLSSRDEHAGKRVRCNACNEVVTVPSPDEDDEPAAPSGPIRFSCEDCGKTVQAKAENAGKKVKCPGCGIVLTIPSAGGGKKKAAVAFTAAKPKFRPGRDDDEDEDEREEQDEDERPKFKSKGKKGKQKSSGPPWLLIGGGLLALLLIGGGVWFFFLRGGSKDGPKEATAGDLDFVPRDAPMFFTARPAEMAKSAVGQKILEKLRNDPGNPLGKMEDETGLKPEDIERATVVFLDPSMQKPSYMIVTAAKAYDRDKMLKMAGGATEQTHNGKTFHAAANRGGPSFHFASDKQFIIGEDAGLRRFLDLPAKPASGALDEIIKVASESKYHAVVGGVIPTNMVQEARQQAGPMLQLMGIEAILDVKTAYSTLVVGDSVQIEAGVELPDGAKADKATKEVSNLLNMAKQSMGAMKMGLKRELGQGGDAVAAEIEKAMNSLTPRQDGNKVVVSLTVDGTAVANALGGAGGNPGGNPIRGNPGGGIRGTMDATTVVNNFKQIGMAMHMYAEQNGGILAQSINDPGNGRPLLSWRVAILPYIEQDNLYKSIRVNEPWDSAHNRQFWDKMPRVYETPGLPSATGLTSVQLFTGPNTPFPGKDTPTRLPATFSDGASNTILIAEAGRPVNWLKPEDMSVIDMNNLRFLLANRTGRGTVVGMADGAARNLRPGVSNATLRALITPSGNEVLGLDW